VAIISKITNADFLNRYNPVLRFGFALWTLGTGLKLLFSQTTPMAVYMIVLIIEGVGVALVHQPGKSPNLINQTPLDFKFI